MQGRHVGALIALSMCAFAYVTAETLPIGLLLPISDNLHVSQSRVGLLVTWYGLVIVLTTIPLTQLTRRIPRRFLLGGLITVFVASTGAAAAAPGYAVLVVARLVTALSQALFWALALPTATALFPARVRGRAISVLMAGTSLAAVLGVPAGTWLGQQAGWRIPFLILGGIGLVAALAIVALVPTVAPDEAPSARGTAPDNRRYRLIIVLTVLAVTGAFASFTYVTPFLVTVSGFTVAATGGLLLARGAAGIGGVFAGGVLVDRNPWTATLAVLVLQTAALLGLYALGAVPVVAVVLVALAGAAFSALTTVLGSRLLQVAPGRTDLAAAGLSTAINVGITAGALIGGVLLPGWGVRSTALAGGVLSIAAVAAVLIEPRLASPGPKAERAGESVPERERTAGSTGNVATTGRAG